MYAICGVVMELYSIEYFRGYRRWLHALTVARGVVIDSTVTSKTMYGNARCMGVTGCDMPRWLLCECRCHTLFHIW